MKTAKKWIAALVAISMLVGIGGMVGASSEEGETLSGGTEGGLTIDAADVAVEQPFEIDAKSAILMEAKTGRVLAEWNADEPLPPASVTKIMTLLLTMEALEEGKFALGDTVQVSEYAASMGGSQVFLKAGESITVEELLKSVVIASANDGAVALAEMVSGNVEGFVARMNERAGELGLKNSHFENPTGLDDAVTNHVFSARDIAIVSRELIVKYPKILEYSCIWMDSIRGGAFGLTNTNRLVRFYRGANGLKTGSTAKAKFCMSATALRDGMQLIAVVMGSPTRDTRNELAKKMLDWGFTQYETVTIPGATPDPIPIRGGKTDAAAVEYGEISFLLSRGQGGKIETVIELPEVLDAPVLKGAQVGRVVYRIDGNEIGTVPITASETVARIGYTDILGRIMKYFFLGGEANQGSAEKPPARPIDTANPELQEMA